MNFKVIFFWSFLGFLLSSCSNDNSSTTSSTRSFKDLYSSSLQGCKNCHALDAAGNNLTTGTNLDFSTASSAYRSLIGQSAQSPGQSACTGASFVTSGNPSRSYFAGVLVSEYQSSSDFGGLTGCSPYNHTDLLSSNEMEEVKAWINDGANE